MTGVISQQGMPTPPKHLIPTLVYPGVRVCNALIFVFICTFENNKNNFLSLSLDLPRYAMFERWNMFQCGGFVSV